jgi:ribosomal protein L13
MNTERAHFTGKNMLRQLKIYAGDKHPHAAQKPAPLKLPR